MDPDFPPSLPNQHAIYASRAEKSTLVLRVIVASVSVGLLGVFLLWGTPYALPYLKPLSVHVFYRLREVSIFLLFTTVIAIGILSSPRKAVNRQKASADQYPLSSIFGESGGSDMIKYALEGAEQKQRARPDDYGVSSAKFYNAVDLASKSDADGEGDASSSRTAEDLPAQSLQRKASEADNISIGEGGNVVAGTEKETPTHRRNLSASREDGYLPVYKGDPRPAAPLITQRQLHRRSSSLDDSVNYEPAPEAERTRSQANAEASLPSSIASTQNPSSGSLNKSKLDIGRAKSVGMQKRVSFSMDRDTPNDRKSQEGEKDTPPSLNSVSQSSSTESLSSKVQPSFNNVENTSGRGEKRSSLSPNELDKKADAFIARFKEQIRLQKLDSFQRYRRRPA